MGITKQIGIMQGRLSPRIDGKIQAYPAKTWQKEFELAQEIGYSAIEWIVEEPMAQNALMSQSGLSEIAKIIEKTNVKVDYICADIFMQQPLIRMNSKTKESNKHYLSQILINANKIGAVGVEMS
jgi:hexulose-6-phosphate isomerase